MLLEYLILYFACMQEKEIDGTEFSVIIFRRVGLIQIHKGFEFSTA